MSGDPLDLEAINHNHVTRDVKALGDCPACDRYRADARAMPPGEDRTAGEYLSWSVSHWRGRARIAEAEVERLRAELAQARTWIVNCVDPAEVGPEVKRQMLDALRVE